MRDPLGGPDCGRLDVFAVPDARAPDLLAAMDGLNDRFGRNTITLAAQGRGSKSFDTKRERKSPAHTTQLAEVPIVR